MDRRTITLIRYAIVVIASSLLSACLHDKDSGTPTVTVETIKPFVSDTFPRTDVTTVSTNQIITITFSEPIQQVETSNIRIAAINPKTGIPETAFSFNQSVLVLSSQDTVLSVKLANDNISLVGATHYLVLIEGIKDYAGNTMTGTCEFIFATEGAQPTASRAGPCKAQPGRIGFKNPTIRVAENSASGQVEVVVTRINGRDGVVSVDYQTGMVANSVSATAGIDYTVTIGTLTFDNGVTEQTIRIPIIDDADIEGDEIFNISLSATTLESSIVGPLTAGAYPTISITITDDEILTSNVLYFIGRSSNVIENTTNGNVKLTVSRALTTDAVSVDYNTVDGSAKQGVDYQSSQGTLNFAVGEKIKTFVVPIIDDKLPEPLKSFTVVLSNAIGARINAVNSSYQVFINDNDQIVKPGNSVLSVSASLKKLHFSWSPVNPNATYQLFDNTKVIKRDLIGNQFVLDIPVHLKDLSQSRFYVKTCINTSCVQSNRVAVTDIMLDTIGYFKPGNTDQDDNFGSATALSDDGLTLVVGAPLEDSDLYGVVLPANVPSRISDNNNAIDSGAVYVYARDTASANWQQTAYIKASNVQTGDNFGGAVTLSGDGLTLAVAAHLEDSAKTGTQLAPSTTTDNNAAVDAGAVYVFTRATISTPWVQQAYIKASNTGAGDHFGNSISLNKKGDSLVIAALFEDSLIPNAINIANNFPVVSNIEIATTNAGAVYVFTRSTATQRWSQQSYLKCNKPDALDFFGNAVDISGDGSTIVVGAYGDDGFVNNIINAGAIYIFTHDGTGVWSQQEYENATSVVPIAASNYFLGWAVAISDDGARVVASSKNAVGNSTTGIPVVAGGVYLFQRGVRRSKNYFRALAPDAQENFGDSVAISGDGNIIAIGVPGDDSNTKGVIFSGILNNLARNAGAVIVYDLGNTRRNQITIKASNTKINDQFGSSVALDIKGNTLAVGALGEKSKATGVKNNSNSAIDPTVDFSVPGAGAVYIY